MFDRLINTLEESYTFNDENEILDEELDTLLDEEEFAVKNGKNPKITTSVGIDPAKEDTKPVQEALLFTGKGEIKSFNPKEMAKASLKEGLGFEDDVEKYIDSFGRKEFDRDEMVKDMSLDQAFGKVGLVEGFDEENDNTDVQLNEDVEYSLLSEAKTVKRFDKPYATAKVQQVLERKNDKMRKKGYLPLTNVNTALKAEMVKQKSYFQLVKAIKLAGVVCLQLTLSGGKPYDFVCVCYYNKETDKIRMFEARCTIKEKKLNEDIQHIEDVNVLDEEKEFGNFILEDYTNDGMESYHLLEESECDNITVNYSMEVVNESLGMNITEDDMNTYMENLGDAVVKRSADVLSKAGQAVGNNSLSGQLPLLPTDAGTALSIITNSMHLVPRNANAVDVESTKKFLKQFMENMDLDKRGLRLYDESIDSEALSKALKNKKLLKNISDFFKMFLAGVVVFTVTCPQLRAKLSGFTSSIKKDAQLNKKAKQNYKDAVESKDETKIAMAKQMMEKREGKAKHSTLTAYTSELINTYTNTEYSEKDGKSKTKITGLNKAGKDLATDMGGIGLTIAGLTLARKIFIKKLDYFLFKIGDMTLITFYNKDAVSMNSHIYPGYLVLVDRAKGSIVFENVNVYGRHVE